MPDSERPAGTEEFVEKLRSLSPAERARAIGEEAKRNLEEVARLSAAEQRAGAARAKLFGQWVMIGSYGAFLLVAWIAYEYMEPALGSELTIGVLGLVSVFVAVGCLRLGENAKWRYSARRSRRQAAAGKG